jgi:hypothetical protein
MDSLLVYMVKSCGLSFHSADGASSSNEISIISPQSFFMHGCKGFGLLVGFTEIIVNSS